MEYMSKNLLIIDDGDNIAPLVEEIARQYQLELRVTTAVTGADGLHHAHTYKPDVILLDVMLPDIDGFAVCRLLKQNPATKDIRILMISGIMNEPEDRARGLESGADDYIFKPFKVADFVASLRQLMKAKRE